MGKVVQGEYFLPYFLLSFRHNGGAEKETVERDMAEQVEKN